MRMVVSLLTSVCFIAAAEASTTGAATPQSQVTPSAPKPSTIDIIRQPSLLHQKLAGNCTTTCQWIGRQQFCNTHCFTPLALASLVLGSRCAFTRFFEISCSRSENSIRRPETHFRATRSRRLSFQQQSGTLRVPRADRDNCFAAGSNGSAGYAVMPGGPLEPMGTTMVAPVLSSGVGQG
jgi:hypothetical protein